MRQLFYKYIFLLGSMSLFSCKKDFLNITGNTSSLYRENYVRDLNSMNEFLSGIYLTFNETWSGSFYKGYPELAADNLKPVNINNQDIIAKYTWTQNVQGNGNPPYEVANMSRDWKMNYRLIRACSFVVEDCDKYRTENPAKADYIKAQAFFFRALMHFKLVNIFAQPYGFTPDASHPGVPYVISSVLSDPYSRQTVKQVYDAMIADLKTSIQLMLETSSNDTRYIGPDVVKALLARIYLFKGDYVLALGLAKEVSDKHPPMTIEQGYPDQLYYYETGTETEVLFHATPENSLNPTSFLGRFVRGSSLQLYATSDIANMLTESSTDVRRSWVSLDGTNWTVTKFPVSTAGIHIIPEADYYDPVIRSSEMFLTTAEAAYRTGDETTAREYLNTIRKRADPNAPDVVETGETLITIIYKERHKELCFENFRLFDLQRWKMDINRSDVFNSTAQHLPYGHPHSIAPIPISDVEIAELKQNVDY